MKVRVILAPSNSNKNNAQNINQNINITDGFTWEGIFGDLIE